MSSQSELTARFRALHVAADPLVLPNAWDPLSAAMVVAAGFPAVATASAAIALSHGIDDGEEIPFGDLVGLTERIAASVDVPVSVDFERGYADSLQGLAENATRLVTAGAVGVNIEDSLNHHDLRSIDDQCERIAAIRSAADKCDTPVFINARTDVFMIDGGTADDAIPRLRAYVDAGADGVYPIMCEDIAVLGHIKAVIGKPINVLLTADTPSVDRLRSVGVTRISMGPGLLSIAAGATTAALARLAAGDLALGDLARLSTSEMRRIQGI